MPCTSAAAARSSQLPSPALETGDKWLDEKESSSLAKTAGQRRSLGFAVCSGKLCLREPGTGWGRRSELRGLASGERSRRDTCCTRNQKDRGWWWESFGGKCGPFFKTVGHCCAGVLQITQNELSAGGHKLNIPQCVNAQREAPHLADLLECCYPTTSHYSSVSALNVQSDDATLNTPRDQI